MKNKFINTPILILIFISMCFVLVGCSVPEGYLGNNDQKPILYENGFFLDNQFPDLNDEGDPEKDKMYFLYNGEEYYILVTGGHEWKFGCDYTIFKDTEEIGNLVEIDEVKNTKTKCICDSMFLDEKYVYYGIRRCIDKKYFTFSFDGFIQTTTYYKYEFYRFDLETKENNSIDVNAFYEKIFIYDETVKLN